VGELEATAKVLAREAFTRTVREAQSGLRADVQKLIDALETGRLLVPLARKLTSIPTGQVTQVDRAVDISPHLLPNKLGQLFIPLFSYETPLDRLMPSLNWTTDGGQLEICWLPAKAALQLAYRAVDERQIVAAVIDVGVPSELQLTRAEIRGILDERALPLVNYASATLTDVLAPDQPAEGVRELVAKTLTRYPSIISHRLERLFDAERELEPRLVLTLRTTTATEARQEWANAIGATIIELLPAFAKLQLRFEP